MKNTIRVCLAVILIFLSISCTREQMNIVKDRLVKGLPDLLGSIAYAYGGQYAGLMGKFVNVISGRETDFEAMHAQNIPQDQGYYYQDEQQDQGYYYQDEQQDQGYYYQEEQQDQEYYYQEEQQDQGYYYQDEQQNQEYYYQDEQQDQEYYYQDEQQDQEYYYQDEQRDQRYDQEKDYAGYPDRNMQPDYTTGLQRLEISIDIVKESLVNGQFQAARVLDGEILTQQDNYKVLFQSNLPCYMYIAQLDATGKLDPILPSHFVLFGNPIQAGHLYDIPAGRNWFYLDANRGIETIYFIASRSPRPDIEQIFAEFEGVNQTLKQQNPVSIQAVHVVTRGIAGTRPGSSQPVSFQNGSEGQYVSTVFESIQADFVMTRWFQHQ